MYIVRTGGNILSETFICIAAGKFQGNLIQIKNRFLSDGTFCRIWKL